MKFSVLNRAICTVGLAFAAASVAIAPAPAKASDAEMGYITNIYVAQNGAILFNTSGSRGALPSCQPPSLNQRFAIDASTTAGQAAASMLINAYNLHKRIWIHGSGTCTIWGDTETIVFFLMED